jgi:hypothetical protein
MRKRLLAIVTTLAAVAALAFVAAAYAAYTSPKLSVTYPGGATRIVASAAVGDDATARAAIVVPNGTGITTTAAPGTKVGTVKAQVSALALGGALLPLAGDILVAPPGAVPAESQTACIQTATPSATYLLVLQAAGQTINLPAYLIPTTGPQTALGPAQLVFCLAPPDIPADKGGATFGAKFLSADLTFNGVFTPLTAAVWIAFWTPWQAGTGQVNAAGTVASVDAILPAGVSLKGKRVNGRVTLTGKVTLAGEGIGNPVQIWGAVGKTGLRKLKTVIARDNGTFTTTLAKTAKQKSFQARTSSGELSVDGDLAKVACDAAFPDNGLGVPCSTFTLAPFTAKSKLVTVR